jgi:hypothetical protein
MYRVKSCLTLFKNAIPLLAQDNKKKNAENRNAASGAYSIQTKPNQTNFVMSYDSERAELL